MNPWHDVELGNDVPNEFPVIIEIPQGSKNKYELCKNTGMLILDRVLNGPYRYPENYGFIPKTYCDDKDPLDVLVIGQEPVYPMTIMNVKPVGVMQMVDGGELDDKIIAVHVDDPQFKHFNDLSELPQNRLAEIKQFFKDYKNLENKVVEVKEFFGREKAIEILRESIELYNKTF